MTRHKLIEHYLIPGALFCLNIAFIHTLYRVAFRTTLMDLEVGMCLISLFLLLGALYVKARYLLIAASVFYIFLLILSCLALFDLCV